MRGLVNTPTQRQDGRRVVSPRPKATLRRAFDVNVLGCFF